MKHFNAAKPVVWGIAVGLWAASIFFGASINAAGIGMLLVLPVVLHDRFVGPEDKVANG